jgi:hypothetical protein
VRAERNVLAEVRNPYVVKLYYRCAAGRPGGGGGQGALQRGRVQQP